MTRDIYVSSTSKTTCTELTGRREAFSKNVFHVDVVDPYPFVYSQSKSPRSFSRRGFKIYYRHWSTLFTTTLMNNSFVVIFIVENVIICIDGTWIANHDNPAHITIFREFVSYEDCRSMHNGLSTAESRNNQIWVHDWNTCLWYWSAQFITF